MKEAGPRSTGQPNLTTYSSHGPRFPGKTLGMEVTVVALFGSRFHHPKKVTNRVRLSYFPFQLNFWGCQNGQVAVCFDFGDVLGKFRWMFSLHCQPCRQSEGFWLSEMPFISCHPSTNITHDQTQTPYQWLKRKLRYQI